MATFNPFSIEDEKIAADQPENEVVHRIIVTNVVLVKVPGRPGTAVVSRNTVCGNTRCTPLHPARSGPKKQPSGSENRASWDGGEGAARRHRHRAGNQRQHIAPQKSLPCSGTSRGDQIMHWLRLDLGQRNYFLERFRQLIRLYVPTVICM